MKKRVLATLLTGVMVLSLAGCGSSSFTAKTDSTDTTTTESGDATETTEAAAPVELNVTTTFAGEDGNAQNFKML